MMGKISKNIRERIEKTFDWVKKNPTSFDDKKDWKETISSGSVKTYCDVMITYNNWLEKQHGISIDRAKPRHAYEYVQHLTEKVKMDEFSAFTLKKIPHALHAFQKLSGKAGAFNRKIRVADKREILKKFKEEGIVRKAVESHSLKASHDDYIKVQEKIEDSKSRYKKFAMEIHETQRELGLRIHEAIKMQVRDIDFEKKQVRVVGKGGLERFVQIHHDAYLKKLKHLSEGKKGGSDVFRIQNKHGDPPSRSYKKEIVQKEIRKAADAAGIARDGKEYTSHSARKAYAQKRVDELKRLHTKTIAKEFEKRKNENEIFAIKADNMLKQVRDKMTNENNKRTRELTKKEMVLFMVSCEIGHFRLDVMRYYVNYDKKTK